MKTKFTLTMTVLTLLVLTACQPATGPERPVNTGDRPRVGEEKPPVEEVLPTLSVESGKTETEALEKHEMKLRSQTSRYKNASKSELEIILTSSALAYCQNESPSLGEGEESLTLTIRAKDGKTAISQQEFAGNDAYELTGIYRDNLGDTTLSGDQFSSLKITDLNNAIARGHLKITSSTLNVDGEYFTAICR